MPSTMLPLEIQEVILDILGAEEDYSALKMCSLVCQAFLPICTARRPDGQPIIDFGSLSKITVSFERPNEGEASQELFRRCHGFTNVSISCK